MPNLPFDFDRLEKADAEIAHSIVGYRVPDLVIRPDGEEYLYRWHVVPRNPLANVYFHIQMASDPERPLHDHPWDNTSVILAGGYDEIISVEPWTAPWSGPGFPVVHKRKKGDVIHRKSSWAHRLILPPDVPYTMSLFTTGPKERGWGFWQGGKFERYQDVTEITDGVSTWKDKTNAA